MTGTEKHNKIQGLEAEVRIYSGKEKWAKCEVCLTTAQGKVCQVLASFIWGLSIKTAYLLQKVFFFRALAEKGRRIFENIFKSLRNVLAGLKHCTSQSSSILRPESKRTQAWCQGLQYAKILFKEWNSHYLVYTLHKDSHFSTLNKWYLKSTIAEVKRTCIKLPHSWT